MFDWNSYEEIVTSQNQKIHNSGISKKSLEKKINFNVIPIERSIIYYGEEGGGLLPIPSDVSVMNSKQAHDPKLVPFALITYIV